jgi:hypothetical protein
VAKYSESSRQLVFKSLHSRRSVIKHGAIALGALALPLWPRRAAQAQSVTFDYYISPSGSDSNPGTQAEPWAITAINSKQSVYTGKKVGLLNGTYNVYSLCQAGAWNRAALVVNGGTPSSPTLIAAVNRQQAILDAHDPSTGAYPTAICAPIGVGPADSPSNLGNFIIDGLVVTGSNSLGITIHCALPGVTEGGATGIIVRNCEVYDITSVAFGDNPAAINPSFVSGLLLQNCLVHPLKAGNTAEICGVVSFNTRGNIYEYNTIYDATIAMQEKEGPQGGSTVRYCYLENNSSSWPTVKDFSGGVLGQVTTFHHNIIVGQTAWENGDATNPNHVSQESLLCFNNTFYYGAGAFGGGALAWLSWGSGDSTSPPATETLYNNIYYSTAPLGGAALTTFNQGTLALSDYNCFQPSAATSAELIYDPPGGGGGAPGYTLSGWRSTTGMDHNSITGNPNFVSPTHANPSGFKLASSSPCIEAGRVGGISSGTRCNMGAWDGTVTQIGCDFSSTIPADASSGTPSAPVLSIT